MRITEIRTSPRFEKQYKKLPNAVKNLAKVKEQIFRGNPFDPRLATHELHGKEGDVWAFSVTGKYRIKFIFLEGGAVLFLEIGTHDIYK